MEQDLVFKAKKIVGLLSQHVSKTYALSMQDFE